MAVLPNALSFFRLLAAPVVAACLFGGYDLAATVLFIVAALTDICDGYVAKLMKAESEFGAWLDPLADKALAVCVYFALGGIGAIPIWLVLLVVARDAMIMLGVVTLRLARRPIVIRPLQISRLNTVVQFLYVGLVMLVVGFDLDETWLSAAVAALLTLLCYSVAATTIGSWIAYAGQWNRMMFRAPQAS
jgi:cardiolipin synthase (CMP-forming)